MNILIYGAGVLGSLYAARLQQAGQNISILARGARYAHLRVHGITLEEPLTKKRSTTRVCVVKDLMPGDVYDLAMVLVRRNQVSEVIPALGSNHQIPSYLFMVNNVAGTDDIVANLGFERVLLGFAGAGGTREGDLIRAMVLPGYLQPTSIGELNGQSTDRVKKIAQILRTAGFPTAIQKNMDAWLKTHAALVSPIANAIYKAGGDIHRLANDPEIVRLMLRAIREGFQVLRSLDIPITPARMHAFEWVPEPLMVALLQRSLDTQYAELVIARHANAARDEMKWIADEFITLAQQTSIHTPSINQLYLSAVFA